MKSVIFKFYQSEPCGISLNFGTLSPQNTFFYIIFFSTFGIGDIEITSNAKYYQLSKCIKLFPSIQITYKNLLHCSQLTNLIEILIFLGVSTTSILLSHFVTQLATLSFQLVFTIVLVFSIFDMPCKGSLPAVIVNFVIAMIEGMMFGNLFVEFHDKQFLNTIFLGFLTSVVCTDQFSANMAANGMILPFAFLCGELSFLFISIDS